MNIKFCKTQYARGDEQISKTELKHCTWLVPQSPAADHS